jgi:hypothetical protein
MCVRPFSFSAEVASWFVEKLAKDREILSKRFGDVQLIPILYNALKFRTFDRNFNLSERYDAEYFFLGWDHGEIDFGGYLQIEIGVSKIFIQRSALIKLEGKELVLETVEVGHPIPARKKCQLLRARLKADMSNPPNS